jgi:hypothetical protein
MRKELDHVIGAGGREGRVELMAYLREIRRRDRRARWATRARYTTIHLSWIIVLLAGGAVSLVEVFGLSTWVAALLGFTVVVFQGIDRVFGRTSQGARAMDVLRRGLEHEQRLLLVGADVYATVDDPGALFVERCERLIGENDAAMVDYFARLTEESAA